MAKPLSLVSFFLCLLLLFNGCLAQSSGRQQQRFGQCQINRLDNPLTDPNHQQFQCAGVAVVRRTIEPNGLLLPQYSNAPQLCTSRGITGVLFPGCPETFEESQRLSQQGQGQSRRFQQDRHQKIRHFREGDILAFLAGVAHWCYNDGDSPVLANFYLTGNPDDEFRPQGQQQYKQHRHQQQRPREDREKTSGATRRQQEGHSESGRRPSSDQAAMGRCGGRDDNGLEETICAARLRENISDPSRADIFMEEAGRISTVNSHNLPVLRCLQLSAESGVLYRTVFDDELREGQILTIPQNFGVVKRARDEGFKWVAFKTNVNAMISPLAGRTSAFRALPEEVLANAFQISKEEARRLKLNRQESTLVRSRSRSSS
ncbi:hypothetical protein I3842_04G186000 [Carya illinoinensis]|uniref:Cupin type-1 domain-containing protein n=1 Tax=Carya illinoinensis TaxID=32201 RepID=A0A922FBS7_CARIL|nr:hypothetical protein I3842_04G186000 [Carya illinoinensis]